MPMCGTRRTMIKPIDNNVWSKITNGPNYVFHNLILFPKTQRFFRVFRIAKIVSTCKTLLTTICAACCKQFLSTNNTKELSNFGTYQILTAVTTRKRKITCSCVYLIGEIRDHCCVFIIGMRCEIKRRA